MKYSNVFFGFLLISLHFLPSLLLPTFFSSLSVFSTFHLPSLCLSLPLKRPTFIRSRTSPLLLCFSIHTSHCVSVSFPWFYPPLSFLHYLYLCYFVLSFVCWVHLSIFFLHPLSGPSMSFSQCLFYLCPSAVFLPPLSPSPSLFPPSSCRPFIIHL